MNIEANVTRRPANRLTHLEVQEEAMCAERVAYITFKNLNLSRRSVGTATNLVQFISSWQRGRGQTAVKIHQLPLAVGKRKYIQAGCFHSSDFIEHFLSTIFSLIHAFPYSAISFCNSNGCTIF
jgi:hypothetical protein